MSSYQNYRPEAFPPVIKNLVIINVLVWIAQLVFEQNFQLTQRIGLWPIESANFRPYQIITHMFAHAAYNEHGGIEFFHILFNMFTLWTFGRVLENVWGSRRFLTFYLICGIGSAIAHMTVQYFEFHSFYQGIAQLKAIGGDADTIALYEDRAIYVVGASGAVMGVMVAFAYLFPNTELMLMFIPVPVKAKWLILALAAYDLFGGVVPSAGDNVAHFAHIGGAITGFIVVLIWNRTNKKTLY